MPVNRNAMIRYVRIDQALKDKTHYYDIDGLLKFVNRGLDTPVSIRQLYEDLRFMRDEPPFRAPIERTMRMGRKRYHYSDPNYSIFSSYISKPETLTDETKGIIENYLNKNSSKMPEFYYMQIMRYLYTIIRENKKPDDKIDLSPFFSSDEIDKLMGEYSSVITYCYDHVRKNIYDLWVGLTDIKPGSDAAILWEKESKKDWKTPILLDAKGVNVVKRDTIDTDGEEASLKYDYVFVGLPTLRGEQDRQKLEALPWIAANMLKAGGQLFIVVQHNFLNGKVSADVRRQLVTSGNKYSLLVVTEPSFTGTMLRRELCLVRVVNDGKAEITLADCHGNDFTNERDANTCFFNWDVNIARIADTIAHCDTSFIWQGKPEELTPNCSLLPSRYLMKRFFMQNKKGAEIVELRKVVSLPTIYLLDEERESCPYIYDKFLSTDYLDCDIDISQINKYVPTNRKSRIHRILKEDCLIVKYNWETVMVGRIKGVADSHVAVDRYTIPLVANTDLITEDFLLRSLVSETTRFQHGMMCSTGNRSERIRYEDFLSIRIYLPSLEEQRRLCEKDRITN